MSSTNKTSNYNLSQFVGSDIPSWLTDYNGDMQKIDAGIRAAKLQGDNLSSAVSALQTAMAGKQNALTFDSTPRAGSSNPVTSAGIFSALQNGFKIKMYSGDCEAGGFLTMAQLGDFGALVWYRDFKGYSGSSGETLSDYTINISGVDFTIEVPDDIYTNPTDLVVSDPTVNSAPLLQSDNAGTGAKLTYAASTDPSDNTKRVISFSMQGALNDHEYHTTCVPHFFYLNYV